MKFNSIKILADENISPRVVSYIRQKGIDIIDVKEEGWQGKDDKFLVEKANKEERYILTHDSDFGTLVVNEGVLCYGIIYLRLRNLQVSNIFNTLEKLLFLDKEIPERSLIVVDDIKIRIRQIE